MKTHSHLRGLVNKAVGTLALPAVLLVGAAGNDLAGQSAVHDQQQVIRGMVSTRTDDSLTVNGTIVDMPATVECTEDGQPIMLEDIQVGDRVQMVVFVDADRGTAVAQTIRDLGR